MKRSVGLVLSAIVLGLAAAGLLLTASAMLLAAFTMPHNPSAQPPPTFLRPIFFGMALLCAALAAWAITTTVGLLFLRTWARYSILVIGGFVAMVGLFSAIGMLVVMLSGTLLHNTGPHPGITDQQMNLVFTIGALCYAMVGAVGVWWLVFFNLRSTKDQFVRRPIIDPLTGLITSPPPPSRRPTAITIIAILLFLATAYLALFTIFGLPLIQFGYLITGTPARIACAALTLFSASLGVGLLRLARPALYGALLWTSVSIVNVLSLILPTSRAHLRQYNQQFQALMPHLIPPTHPAPAVTTGMLLYSISFGVLTNLAFAWFLFRHRLAFTPPPPPST